MARAVSSSLPLVTLTFLLLVGTTRAQIRPRPLPGRPSRPVNPGRRQPVPSQRVLPNNPFRNGGRQGPSRGQPVPISGGISPPMPGRRLPMPPYYPGHGHMMHPPPNSQPSNPAPANPGAGGAPYGTVYCAPNEYYRLGHEMCCGREVIPMPYPMPAQFAQCCDGEVIDNRTEACCMGQERVFLAEQGCCGPEVYDRHAEACCGTRIYEPRGQLCCGGQLMSGGNMVCCRGTPSPVRGDPSQTMCCGAYSINTNTHMCCGKRIVQKNSGTHGCCGNRMVYRTQFDGCCRSVTGRWMVRPGRTCELSTRKPPTIANPPVGVGKGQSVVVGPGGLAGRYVQILPDGRFALVPMPPAGSRPGVHQPNNGNQLMLLPVGPGHGQVAQPGAGMRLIQPGPGGIIRPVPALFNPGVPSIRVIQPGLPIPRNEPRTQPMITYPRTFKPPQHNYQIPVFTPPRRYPSDLPRFTTPAPIALDPSLIFFTGPQPNTTTKPRP